MLIAMTGLKRSGKDTVALMLHKRLGVEPVSFAATLKGMLSFAMQCAGYTEEESQDYINGDKKEEPLPMWQGKTTRHAMQTLGTEWRDLIGKNLWTDITILKVKATEKVVLTDMRFLHEEAFVEDNIGLKIRVKRAGQTESNDPHPSEVEMSQISPDITVYNHGSIEDLEIIADSIAAIVNDRYSRRK